MHSLIVMVVIMFLHGCASQRYDQVTPLANESLAMVQAANLSTATPEARLAVADRLLTHMKQYDLIILDPYAITRDQQAALRFKRTEAEMAASIMRNQAKDYADTGDIEKSRALYYAIIKTFSSDAYNGIRRTAETELRQLDEKISRASGTYKP